MSVINNLTVGLIILRNWKILAKARRCYEAFPREARYLVVRAPRQLKKTRVKFQGDCLLSNYSEFEVT